MTVTITTPPATRPAQVSGNPQAFDAAKAEWQTWMQSAIPLMNAQNAENDNKHLVAVAAGESTAYTAAQTVAAAAVALAGANCRGAWSGLTGALNTPASVIHNGQLWVLTANLANVTTATPGVSSSWAPLAQWYALDVADRVPAVQPTLDLDFARQKYRVYDSATGGLATAALSSVLTYTGSAREYVDGKGVLVVQGSNVPRLEFDPATTLPLGVSTWGARTNHWLHSNDFSNAAWGKVRASITATAWTSQRGQVFAKLVEDSSASIDHYVGQSYAGFTSGVSYSLFVDVKPAERSFVQLWFPATIFSDAATRAVTFNVSTGAVFASSGSGITSSAKDMGEGIWRLRMTITATATASTSPLIRLHNGTSDVYTGNGTSGLYISRAMVSATVGDAPHIPTTTAAVTAPADAMSITGSNFTRFFNPAEGTLLRICRPDYNNLVGSAANWNDLSIGASGNTRASLRCVSDPVLAGVYADMTATWSGTNMSDTANTMLSSAPVVAQALAYTSTGWVISLNGQAAQTGNWATANFPAAWTQLFFGDQHADTQVRWVYWPKNLSALLPQLTAV